VIAADVPVWLQKNGVKLLGVDLPSMDELDRNRCRITMRLPAPESPSLNR